MAIENNNAIHIACCSNFATMALEWTPAIGRTSERSKGLKHHDTAVFDVPIKATGGVTSNLIGIRRGSGEADRIGRKIVIISIDLVYKLNLLSSDEVHPPLFGEIIRVILYLDKQCNGAAAVTSDLLESNVWYDFPNTKSEYRMVFLMDRFHSINYLSMASESAGTVTQAQVREVYTWGMTCNIPIEYSGANGVIADINSNIIGMLTISDVGQNVVFDGRLRFKYIDA